MIERQAIHRGTYRSVNDLNTRIRTFIDGSNDRCHPFVWTTKAAEDNLKKPTTEQLQTPSTSGYRMAKAA